MWLCFSSSSLPHPTGKGWCLATGCVKPLCRVWKVTGERSGEETAARDPVLGHQCPAGSGSLMCLCCCCSSGDRSSAPSNKCSGTERARGGKASDMISHTNMRFTSCFTDGDQLKTPGTDGLKALVAQKQSLLLLQGFYIF